MQKATRKGIFLLLLVIDLLFFISLGFSIPTINNENDIDIDFSRIDKESKNINYPKTKEDLVQSILNIAQNDWEKARALYLWICRNIEYDTESFFGNEIASQNSENVFASKKSVCEGYSELTLDIGTMLGLNIVKVSGYAKGYGYYQGKQFESTDHAWIAFQIDEQWYLMDPTWGAGYVDDDKKFVRDVTTTWFAMDPRLFLYTHYPEDQRYLFLESPAPSLQEYINMQYIPAYIFKYLWRNDFTYNQQIEMIKILTERANNLEKELDTFLELLFSKKLGFSNNDVIQFLRSRDFPKFYSFPLQLSVIDVPKTGTLKAGKEYVFSIKISNAQAVAIICNDVFFYMKEKDGIYYKKITPRFGPVHIAAKPKNGKTYYTAIMYEVR